ncbi:MAG: FHA domain-containing protein [Chloroflexi bacterium]|nr:FHA domain-containing protein [Chloroflexota bacterium]MCL5275586.1 FHA domain-containing protein [Chloroflexota bacterium]
MKTKLTHFIAVFGLLLSVFGRTLPGFAQSVNTYFITNVDSSHFPNIQFRLRALDSNNHAVTDLTSANLPLFENGKPVPPQNVQVTPHNDGPLTIVFVIDQGAQSNYQAVQNALKQAISHLVDGGYFVDGRDTVKLVVRENPGAGDRTTVKLGATQQGRDLLNFISGYTFPRSAARTKGLKGIDDAVADMSQLVPNPGAQDAAIIFFSRMIEDPQPSVAATAAQNSASDAKAKFITIYSVQTDSALADQQPLQLVALGSNGKFVKLLPNAASAAVDGIYQALAVQRQYYTVSYASPSGESGSRLITVGSAEKPSVGASGEYQVNVSPPLVTLTPQTSFLRRAPVPGAADGQNPYSPLSVRAQVDIAWTDGITRSIKQIDFSVNGVKQSTLTGDQLTPGKTSFELIGDLSAITKPGANIATLSVQVLDALGSQASATERVTVEVVPPMTPSPTPAPGLTLDNPAAPIVLVAVVLILLIVVIVLLATRRRGSGAGAHAPGGRTSSRSSQPAAEKALATLIVLQGPPNMLNQPLRVTKARVVLGRDSTSCDIAFYAGQPSSVSGVHAVLEYNEQAGFTIKDNGSTNGTMINARKLRVGVPEPIRDGDEITLGDTANRGVKIRFATGQGDRWANDDKTQIRM